MSASSSGAQLRDNLKAQAAAATDAEKSLVENILTRPAARWVTHKASTDAAASTAYRLVLDAGLDVQTFISEVKVVTNANVTADASNYATVALVYNDGAAGSDTTVATLDTSVTSFTAKVARAMTVTDANRVIAAGKQLELVVTKAASGVSLPAVSVIVKGYPV